MGKSSEKLGEFSEKGGDTSEKVGETSEKLGDASEKSDVSVVCRYEDVSGRPVAVLRRSWGRGRVLLSGVHWEVGMAFTHLTLDTRNLSVAISH